MNAKIRSALSLIIVIAVFVVSSWYVQTNMEFFESLIVNDALGVLVYIFIEVISIVVAPVTTIFLLPVAANLWGWFFAAVISIFAWTVGAIIAFSLARVYGVDLVKRFIPMNKIYSFEKKIPDGNIFWTIVFFRMVIPVDVLSYALGLFSKVKTRTYILASIIGMSPFAFLFAYLGTLPWQYQILGWVLAGVAILMGVYFILREEKG